MLLVENSDCSIIFVCYFALFEVIRFTEAKKPLVRNLWLISFPCNNLRCIASGFVPSMIYFGAKVMLAPSSKQGTQTSFSFLRFEQSMERWVFLVKTLAVGPKGYLASLNCWIESECAISGRILHSAVEKNVFFFLKSATYESTPKNRGCQLRLLFFCRESPFDHWFGTFSVFHTAHLLLTLTTVEDRSWDGRSCRRESCQRYCSRRRWLSEEVEHWMLLSLSWQFVRTVALGNL